MRWSCFLFAFATSVLGQTTASINGGQVVPVSFAMNSLGTGALTQTMTVGAAGATAGYIVGSSGSSVVNATTSTVRYRVY